MPAAGAPEKVEVVWCGTDVWQAAEAGVWRARLWRSIASARRNRPPREMAERWSGKERAVTQTARYRYVTVRSPYKPFLLRLREWRG